MAKELKIPLNVKYDSYPLVLVKCYDGIRSVFVCSVNEKLLTASSTQN